MLARVKRRVLALLRRDAMESELDRELRYHLDRQIEANVKSGMGPEEARQNALRTFGGIELSKEHCRDARGVRWLDDLTQDVRYGIRTLVGRPAFTAVVLLTLALGIGANSAIFSVVDTVLLRPMPFTDPDRLVVLWEANRQREGRHRLTSPANFLEWRGQSSSFESLVALVTWRRNLSGGGEPEEATTQFVSPGFFEMLGRDPIAGRALIADDHLRTADGVVVLSYGLWQRRFGGDPGVVGRAITLHGEPRTVAGVMPRDFHLTIKENAGVSGEADLWAPLELDPTWPGRFLMVVGKLKPDVPVDAAEAEMNLIASRLAAQHPDYNTGLSINLVPLHDQLVVGVRPALLVLASAVGFVLLIACANVANLLLMRSASRRREIAMRSALGAGRLRVMRQLLTESLCLSALGGLLGLLLALWATDHLLALAPADLVGASGIKLDMRMLGFTVAVSVVTGVIFGLAPALQASKVDLNGLLKEGGRSATADRRTARLSRAFVVAEIALALVLLIGAGLLLRSFSGLHSIDPGFDAEGVITAKLELPEARYGEESHRIAFFGSLLERVRAIPGVRSASAVSALPFGGLGTNTNFAIEGRPEVAAGEEPGTDVSIVDPYYFQTMAIPVLDGRTFTTREASVASHVVIVSETLANRYFSGERALGKRIKIDLMENPSFCEIVGVVGDVRTRSLEAPVEPMIYWPYAELPASNMAVVVHSNGNMSGLVPLVRGAVHELDPDLPISNLRAMESWMADSLARSRFSTVVLALFGAVAFILAVLGIYGVLSYSVALRTNEIGLRMALGAQRADVLRMVLLDGFRLTVAGLAIGLVAASLLSRFIASLLFGVEGTDLLTYTLASLLFLTVSVLACTIPARRAITVDPITSLR